MLKLVQIENGLTDMYYVLVYVFKIERNKRPSNSAYRLSFIPVFLVHSIIGKWT